MSRYPRAFTIPILTISFLLWVQSTAGQGYEKFHQQAIVVDTHNDFPSQSINKNVSLDMALKGKTHTDLRRLKEGGVDVQIFSVWCDGDRQLPFEWANRQIDSVHAWVQRNPDQLVIAKTPADIQAAIKSKKTAIMTGVEGGHMIENDLAKLRLLYQRGVRYMTLTWNNSTDWASSAMDEKEANYSGHRGLTPFGKEVVSTMNKLGMLVDLSHTGVQTFNDVLAITTKPVLVSHSCTYALCPQFRNLTDEQIAAIGKNGGVIHVNFFNGFVDSTYMPKLLAFQERTKLEADSILARNPQMDKDYVNMMLTDKYKTETEAWRPPLSMLIDHIDRIVRIAGIDHVGLGSDFDGINAAPVGLDGVENFPLITKELLDRGYSRQDVRKILGENFLRLFTAVQPPED